MDRTPVTSGQIKSFGYDPEGEILEIEFINGLIYRYLLVDKATYEAFLIAESKGKFLNIIIKPRYSFIKVEEKEEEGKEEVPSV